MTWKIEAKVKITPCTFASKRTKERITQHGPDFNIMDRGTPSCMCCIKSVALQSIISGWIGWLPIHEIVCCDFNKSKSGK